MKQRQALWTPFQEADPPYDPCGFKLFVNSRYQVGLKGIIKTELGRVLEVTIKNRDKSPIYSWRDMQKIKNDLVGEDATMLQIFPPEKYLVDTANQYYFYVLLDYELPFGFKERLISERTDMTNPKTNGINKQEPFEAHQLPPDMPAEQDKFDQLVTKLDATDWPGFTRYGQDI